MDDILKQIPEKQLDHKDTTSRLWKQNLYDFFVDKKINNCLEIGTNSGWTSLWCSHFFNHIYTIENLRQRHNYAKGICSSRDNITFIMGDAYDDSTYKSIPKDMDVIIIDCIHTYNAVMADINRALTFYNNKKIYLVFDDHGHPELLGVHSAIQEAIDAGLKVEKHIGEPSGYVVNRPEGTSFELIRQEGIILSYG